MCKCATDGILLPGNAGTTTHTTPIWTYNLCCFHLCRHSLWQEKVCTCMCVLCSKKLVFFFFSRRVIKQTVSPRVSVLGGISLKVFLPSVVHAIAEFLNAHSLNLPPGPLPTVYRIEKRGTVFYSKQYLRVKKMQKLYYCLPQLNWSYQGCLYWIFCACSSETHCCSETSYFLTSVL